MQIIDLTKLGTAFAASLAANGQPVADELLQKAVADLQPIADQMEATALSSLARAGLAYRFRPIKPAQGNRNRGRHTDFVYD